MTKELAIKILSGDTLGTNEQTHEAVCMAVKALTEQKHGHWIEEYKTNDGKMVHCSACRMVYWIGTGREGNYCPNCGAKMDAPTQKSVGKALKALEATDDS